MFAEYLIGSRSSINVGYVGNKSKLPGDADRGQPAAARRRRPEHLGAAAARAVRSTPFNPAITNISTTASRGRADYNALQTTFKQRLWNGLDFVANYTLSEANSNNLGYYGSGNVAAEGAYPVNSYDIEANYGPAFFDAQAHLLDGRQLRAAVRQGPAVRQRLEPRHRRGGRRLGGELRRHRAHAATRSRCRTASRRSLQGTRSTEWPDLIGDPVPADQTLERWINRDAFAHPRRSARSATPASASCARRATGTSTCRVSKRFATFGRQYLQFRGEMFNVLNHPNFGPPNRDIQSQTFGTITATAADARVVQLVLKYFF